MQRHISELIHFLLISPFNYLLAAGRASLSIITAFEVPVNDSHDVRKKQGDRNGIYILNAIFVITGTPFHSLPVLSWDGEEVGQSVTIARFCAKKTGLAGKDDLEQARADAIVDQVIDCFAGMIGVIFASDSTSPVPASAPNRSEENKKVKGDDMFGNKFPHFLKVVDRHLKKNGGKWMVGDSVSVVFCVCAIRFAPYFSVA